MAKSRIIAEDEVEDVETNEEERDANLDTDETTETEVEETDEDAGGASDDESEESEESIDEEDQGGEEEEEEEELEHIIVSIGGDEEGTSDDDEHQPAPQWVRDLRRQRKEDARRIKELEAQLAEKDPTLQAPGPEPTMEDADYNADVYKKRLKEWYERKNAFDEKQRATNEARAKQQAEYNARRNKYDTDKVRLKVPDFEEAEDVVVDVLSEAQQGILVQGSDDPALLVYALGKNEKKARELAAIQDPVKFIFAVAKLEAQLKVTTKRRKPKPESRITGGGRGHGGGDSQLNRLRAEAERTGDYTKVNAYNKRKRTEQE